MLLLPLAVWGKTPLKDRVVLIAGASGDIGFATAKRFLQDGAFVVAHYNQNKGRLEALKVHYPDHLKLIATDFREPKNVEALWKESLSWKKKMDIIVNSSGVDKEAKPSDDLYSVIHDTMAINYFSPVLLSTLALDHFKKTKIPGVIINIGSRATFRRLPEGYYHYSDSKAALTRYTQQIAKDNADKGIVAVVIAPGPVEGQMFGNLNSDVRKKCLESMPTKKPVTIEEVVNVIDFYATGQAPSGTVGVFDLMGASWTH